MATPKTLTNLDVDAIKADLKQFMRKQTRFKDYDFEGSNMSILMDLLAYNTFQNNFFANMMFSELFTDSAQLKRSMFSHCKELNYLPRSARSAMAKIRVNLMNVDSELSFVSIPARTRFNGNKNGKTFFFYNENAITVENRSGIFYAEFDILEGVYATERFVVKPDDEIRDYVINSDNVDLRSVIVKVYQDLNDTVGEPYNNRSTLYELDSDDRIYMMEPNHDGKYKVVFGRDVVGREPKAGEVVDVTYRVCNTSEPNGTDSFSIPANVLGYNIVVETLEPAVGGTEEESIESIRVNAPRAIQIQNRAVTNEDYRLLLMREFPEIQAVSVYGGESETIPMYGRVIVIVDVQGGDGASQFKIEEYEKFLKKHCPITITPVVRSARFMYPIIDATIYYDDTKSDKAIGDIMQSAMQAILKYSDDHLSGFGTPVRTSRLTTLIDSIDVSVLSSDIEVRPSVDMIWKQGIPVDEVIEFKQKLNSENLLSENSTSDKYKPSVVTSSFFYNGNNAFIQDDGTGVLSIYSLSPQKKYVVLKQNVGWVDYETGKVTISGFTTQGSIKSGPVQLVVRSCSCDITPPPDRIIRIREKDISIKMSVEE